MEFKTTLVNVSLMLFYLLIGYVLAKTDKACDKHARTLSSLLLYVSGPAMIISAFLNLEYSKDYLKEMGLFFITTLILQIAVVFILYLILKRKFTDAKYRILTFGAVCGNVGFFGLPLVCAIFPDKPIVSVYSSVYVMSMNLIAFTLGVFLITQNKKFISLKAAVLNPTTIAILVALPLYIFNVSFPQTINDTIGLLGKMSTPLCMIILGLRMSAMKISDIFKSKFAYLACALKLIIFPLFCYLCVYFLPFLDPTFKAAILILSAAPSGATILSLAELHQSEQELCASVVLLCTLLCIITIPVISLII